VKLIMRQVATRAQEQTSSSKLSTIVSYRICLLSFITFCTLAVQTGRIARNTYFVGTYIGKGLGVSAEGGIPTLRFNSPLLTYPSDPTWHFVDDESLNLCADKLR
jgi:hypothetical protein